MATQTNLLLARNYRRNGNFSKGVIYFTKKSLQRFASAGKLKYYCLYLMLKKEYVSGHIHSCKKPSWYKNSQQQYYYDLKELKALGLITTQHGKGIRIASLLRVTDSSRTNFHPTAKVFSGTVKQLYDHFIQLIVRYNYIGQLKNIVLKELGLTWGDLHISKRSMRLYRKSMKLYTHSQRALKFTKFGKHNTSLGIRRCGELFGKSSWFGFKVFNDLIEAKIVERFVVDVKVPCTFTPSTLPHILKLHPRLIFKGDGLYKRLSTFWFKG